MNKLRKLFALFSFIFYLFYGSANLFAANVDENVPYTDSGKEQGGGFFATMPECTSGISEAIIAAVTLIIAGKNFILPGIISLTFGNPTPATKIIAGIKIGIGVGMIGYVTTTFSTSFQCFFSFVQDPVTYQDDNKNKPMLTEGGKPTTKRWEAAGAPYSKNMSVCARPIAPYLSLLAINDKFSCYGTNDKYGTDNKFYDGPKAFLCPEEWRYHGYRSEIKEDSKDKKKEKYAIRGNAQDDDESSGGTDESKFMRDLLHMRQHDGPLECETHVAGDEFSLHGYRYKVIKMGAKLCAKLQGIALLGGGVLPSLSGGFIIGCHYTTPDEPSPLCERSTKIFKKKKQPMIDSSGNPVIDPDTGKQQEELVNDIDLGTGEPILIDYDNSKCFACYIGKSCHSATSGHSKAVMPLTSYIMECIHSTVKNVMFGCKNSVTGQTTKDSGLFSQNLPKVSEMMTFLIKIAVILYMVNGTGENNGQQWFYNKIQQLSSGLGALVMRASVENTGICYFQDELYKVRENSNQIGSKIIDLSYIKPYDIMDCLLFFYIGGALVGYDQSHTLNLGEVLANALPRLLMIIMPLFALFDLGAFIAALALFLFAIIVIALTTWFVSLMVLTTIMLFFLILISPIVLPMMLFGYTKSFFDNWIKEIIAYTLFPPMLFLFFGLMLAVFNAKMFGETRFSTIDIDILGRKARHSVFTQVTCSKNSIIPVCKSCEKFMIDPAQCDGCDPASLACQFRFLDLKKSQTVWSQSTITPDKSKNYFLNLLESVGYIILMAIIFMTLVTTIAFLVAKVVGGSRSLYQIIGNGISPMTAFMKTSKYAFKPTKMALSGLLNKAKQAQKNTKKDTSTSVSGGGKNND